VARTDLKLSGDQLADLKDEVLFASIALGDVTRLEDFGAALGHQGLASRVAELSTGWDLRRGEIVKAMDTLWAALGKIESTFDDVEGQLASHLQPK
jgi:hypothetical protein